MECHVEWDPKGEDQHSCHHGDVNELLQNLLQHLNIEPNLRELVELKEQAYPGNEDRHRTQPPLPLGSTEALLLNRAHEAGSENQHGDWYVYISVPILPEPPVDEELAATITSIQLNELVEPHQQVDTTHHYCSSSSNERDGAVTVP